VGSVILAAGFQSFDPAGFDNYPYAGLPEVVTSGNLHAFSLPPVPIQAI